MKGRKYQFLRKKASKYRRRMIAPKKYRRHKVARNKFHLADLFKLGKNKDRRKYQNRANKILQSMPARDQERLQKLRGMGVGRKALRKHKQFTGIPLPTRLDEIDDGSRKVRPLVVMGTEPFVLVANGPKGRNTKVKKLKGSWLATTTPNGRQIIILRNKKVSKGFGKGLKFIGWIPETHYVLNKRVENAGSFKRGKYWVHKNGEEGGSWPKGYMDKSGNIHYRGGSYKVGKWIIN